MQREPDFVYNDVQFWWAEMEARFNQEPAVPTLVTYRNGQLYYGSYLRDNIYLNKEILESYHSWLAKQIVE